MPCDKTSSTRDEIRVSLGTCMISLKHTHY